METVVIGVILILAALQVCLFIFGPFPHLPSYGRVWRAVLFHRDKGITLKARIKNAQYLLKDLVLLPVLSFFWLLDELLYPGYREAECEAVVCILGQPRSGSTFFHRTLGGDEEKFVAIRHLEWRYPSICLQNLLARLGLADRLARKSYWPDNPAGRMAARMHPHELGNHEEDGIFFEERLYHHYFVYRRFPYPGLAPAMNSFAALSEREQMRLLRIHRKVIQKVLYRRGRGRMVVLKENESMELLPKMTALFPKVFFIGIIRDPEPMLESYQQLSKLSTLAKTGIDPERVSGWAARNLDKRRIECGLMVSFFAERKQRRDLMAVSYRQFVANIFDTVQCVYHRLGLEIGQPYRAHLERLEGLQKNRDRGYVVKKTANQSGCNTFAEFDEFAWRIEQEHKTCLQRA